MITDLKREERQHDHNAFNIVGRGNWQQKFNSSHLEEILKQYIEVKTFSPTINQRTVCHLEFIFNSLTIFGDVTTGIWRHNVQSYSQIPTNKCYITNMCWITLPPLSNSHNLNFITITVLLCFTSYTCFRCWQYLHDRVHWSTLKKTSSKWRLHPHTQAKIVSKTFTYVRL